MNEPNDEVRAQLMAIIEKHVNALGEHFENVQIFANNLEHGGKHTTHFQMGSGNWYARYGHAKAWVIQQEERERKSVWCESD